MPLKEFIIYSSQEEGTCHITEGHRGSARFDQEAEGTWGRHELFSYFLKDRKPLRTG